MNVENQVCSQELSKRLDELGVKQESLFYHHSDSHKIWKNKHPDGESYSAFTVAELGEMLPNNTEPLTYWTMKISTAIPTQLWTSDILFARKSLKTFYAESEANLRAEMLIYLLENKLMELPNG